MKSFSLCSLALRSAVPLRIIRPIIRPSQLGFRSISRTTGQMTSQRDESIPHELRTAAEPRQNRLYPVRLSHIEQVNPSVRLLQFTLPTQENNVWKIFFFFFFLLLCFLSIYVLSPLPSTYILSPSISPQCCCPRAVIHMPRTANVPITPGHLLSHTFTQKAPLMHCTG
jgi:hypothetical protein